MCSNRCATQHDLPSQRVRTAHVFFSFNSIHQQNIVNNSECDWNINEVSPHLTYRYKKMNEVSECLLNWTERHMGNGINDPKCVSWAESTVHVCANWSAWSCSYKWFVYIVAIHTSIPSKCNHTCDVQTDDSTYNKTNERTKKRCATRIVWEPHVKNQWKS